MFLSRASDSFQTNLHNLCRKVYIKTYKGKNVGSRQVEISNIKEKKQTAKENISITTCGEGEDGWQQDSKRNEGGGRDRERGSSEGGLWLRDERGVWEVKLLNPLGSLTFSHTYTRHTCTHSLNSVRFHRKAGADTHKETLNGRKTEIKGEETTKNKKRKEGKRTEDARKGMSNLINTRWLHETRSIKVSCGKWC